MTETHEKALRNLGILINLAILIEVETVLHIKMFKIKLSIYSVHFVKIINDFKLFLTLMSKINL